MTPKHPEIIVTLTGQDGNSFAVLGRCRVSPVSGYGTDLRL